MVNCVTFKGNDGWLAVGKDVNALVSDNIFQVDTCTSFDARISAWNMLGYRCYDGPG